uniref:VWA domain-containing protein n=1 Tax=Eubacterium cellulosolvens TaxID=29322 RepID=UPI0009DCA13C|nr:vWA domain-containing protein [[Eubacterium] cellulosolvens]
MRRLLNTVIRKSICLAVVALLFCGGVFTESIVVCADEEASQNRFNVEIVLDASNSMNYTDPDGLRYEAISQFVNLLANEGNYLGGVVFSNKVEAQQAITKISDVQGKDAVTNTLKSVMSTGVTEKMGYTNIGDGIDAAVEDIEKNGSNDLPSVIVFLSDGNTEMPTDDEQKASLNKKAEAIEKAREKEIHVYSICLNANGKADRSEMDQISSATGGESKEVKNAGDLADVFQTFYALIYGSASIALEEGDFPQSGEIKTGFEVPGIGVEEVNIVANGQIDELHVFDPEGKENNSSIKKSRTYAMVKLTEPVPGKWSIVTKGKPGTKIKINMVYNTDLGVIVKSKAGESISTGDPFDIQAVLKNGEEEVTDTEKYGGYEAEATLMDAYGKKIETIPMSLKDGGFYCECKPDEGVYYADVTIRGNDLEKTSDAIGPVTVAKEEPPVNTAPEPVEQVIEKTVMIWPVKGGSLELDLSNLAKDKQDKKLSYTIESSSYIEGNDFECKNNVLKMTHFSLSRGSFDIKATDTGGLSCHVELKVQTINIGAIALIGIGVSALVALAVVLILLRIALTKPFRGKITVQSNVRGQIKSRSVEPRRGRCRLSLFRLDATGLNYSKSYFQASGSNYVTLITDKPVIADGRTSSNIKIQSGVQTTIRVRQDSPDVIQIRFDGRVKNVHDRKSASGSRRPSGPARKNAPGRSGRRGRPAGRAGR